MDVQKMPPPAGQVINLEACLRMILAPNPSPMTYWGTNTYILGATEFCVIDPGPDSEAHLDAILSATEGGKISHILVTHNHLDHSPLAARLSERCGAPIAAFGTHLAGRSAQMSALASQNDLGGGEGIDLAFQPDIIISDQEVITGADWSLTALHTPGHIANHLSFRWNDAIFTGDHVMGWASSLVSPPDGDLGAFMASCTKLQQAEARIFYPAHGAPVTTPQERLAWLIDHRLTRERQILACLAEDDMGIRQITAKIYQDVPAPLIPAAQRNVFAHLIDLHNRGEIAAVSQLGFDAVFRRMKEF